MSGQAASHRIRFWQIAPSMCVIDAPATGQAQHLQQMQIERFVNQQVSSQQLEAAYLFVSLPLPTPVTPLTSPAATYLHRDHQRLQTRFAVSSKCCFDPIWRRNLLSSEVLLELIEGPERTTRSILGSCG